MPFRTRAKLLERVEADLEKATGDKNLSVPITLALTEILVERIWAAIRIFSIIIFFLFVITVALEIQVQQRNRNIVKVEQSTTEARKASERAQEAVEAAIKQSADPNALKPFLEDIERSKRIERRLCGGPCP